MSAAFSGHLLRSVPASLRLQPAYPRKPTRSFAVLFRRPLSGRRCAAARGSVEPATAGADAKALVEFLYDDLPHLFDEQGIDRTMYDNRVVFRDPITKHDTIDGYLFNIRFLKLLFRPNFYLHFVRQVILTRKF